MEIHECPQGTFLSSALNIIAKSLSIRTKHQHHLNRLLTFRATANTYPRALKLTFSEFRILNASRMTLSSSRTMLREAELPLTISTTAKVNKVRQPRTVKLVHRKHLPILAVANVPSNMLLTHVNFLHHLRMYPRFRTHRT